MDRINVKLDPLYIFKIGSWETFLEMTMYIFIYVTGEMYQAEPFRLAQISPAEWNQGEHKHLVFYCVLKEWIFAIVIHFAWRVHFAGDIHIFIHIFRGNYRDNGGGVTGKL